MRNRIIQAARAAARTVFAIVICLVVGEARAQTQTPARPALPAVSDSIRVKDLEAAIIQGEELIKKYPDSDFTPSVMFQLVELYVKRSSYAFQKSMGAYEQELVRYDAGEIKSEPNMPRVSYAEAIAMGYKILSQYPTAPFNDKVIYRVALCQFEENNRDLARDYFQKLIDEHPKSEYVLEACFRLGEYYFDKRDYATAITYYSRLLNQWQNPFFQMSLYKLAWSHYNVNDYSKAISTFIYLIDDIKLVDNAKDTEVLGKTKMDLRQESIEYLAQCFAEYGGAKRAKEFLDKFRGKDYGIDIFLKLADTYQARNDYDESNRTLAATLELWPLNEQAPLLQSKIVENYLRSGDAKSAELARENLVSNYGPGSAWIEKYSKLAKGDSVQQKVRDKALALAEENLYILATEAQTHAHESSNVETYRLAIGRYQQFIDKFPASPNAAKTAFYLAECHYEIKEFAAAAAAYQQVLMKYPDSEFRDDAAYNRILSHFEELSTFNAADSARFVLNNFIGSGKSDTLTVPNTVYPKLLTACNDFATLLTTSPRLPEVMMKYGETLFNLREFGLAQQVYEKVITGMPASRFVVQAHLLHAQCAMENQDYLAAEKWARKVVENFPDSARQVTKAQKLISSAKFKLAEGLKEQEKFDIAAQAFENIAASSEDSTISELALAEAAAQFDKAGDKEKAIEIYEKFYLKFPKSARVDEALFRAALLCEDLGKWTKASQNYLALVSARATSPFAAKALFAAARCYESAGLMENALKTYDRFLESYPNELDQNLEALCRAGDIHYQRKDFSQASDYFKRALARYQQAMREGLPAEPYLAAQAQFTLAEMRFETYKNVKLEPPLDRSLQRKQTLFNEVLGAYKDAATYQIAEWFTAASHRIGSTYEEFGRAFWESPRPALAEDLLAKYEEQLSQKIRPFKERALETYRGNLRQAAENGIDNEWVNQSRQRMQALAAELGQGMESSEPANGTHEGGQSLDQGAMNGQAPADSQSVHTASAKGNQK